MNGGGGGSSGGVVALVLYNIRTCTYYVYIYIYINLIPTACRVRFDRT